MGNTVHGLTGTITSKTATPRKIFYSSQGVGYSPKPLTLSGTYSRDPGNTNNVDVLRDGVVIGWDADNSVYRTAFIDLITTSVSAGATSLTITAAGITELTRLYGTSGTNEFAIWGPADNVYSNEDDIGYIEYITHSNLAGTTITCSALEGSYPGGAMIVPAECVRSTGALGRLTDLFVLKALNDNYATKVTDDDGNNISVGAQGVISGILDVTKIVNFPTHSDEFSSVVEQELNSLGRNLMFSDRM